MNTLKHRKMATPGLTNFKKQRVKRLHWLGVRTNPLLPAHSQLQTFHLSDTYSTLEIIFFIDLHILFVLRNSEEFFWNFFKHQTQVSHLFVKTSWSGGEGQILSDIGKNAGWKGHWHEIFVVNGFSLKYVPNPLIHTLKPFRIHITSQFTEILEIKTEPPPPPPWRFDPTMCPLLPRYWILCGGPSPCTPEGPNP
jgi:hypothetical protein